MDVLLAVPRLVREAVCGRADEGINDSEQATPQRLVALE
jgi:hypothetical protein